MSFLARGLSALVVRCVAGRKERDGGVDPARFGIALQDPRCFGRARAILTAFFLGFERGLESPDGAERAAAGVDPLVKPFFHEGFAMGSIPNGYLRLVPSARTLSRFEARFPESDPFVFLRYVGVGFWLGFRHGMRPWKVDRLALRLRGNKYAPLIHDGFGFQVGFFSHRHVTSAGSAALHSLEGLEGFARASAANGLGRSLWFFTMDSPHRGVGIARRLGTLSLDVLGGLGLAAAFTFPDELSRAYGLADTLPPEERRTFLKGVRIALYVRHRCDASLLERWLGGLPAPLGDRARADLDRALRVGGEAMHKVDFIEAFHRGCLDG